MKTIQANAGFTLVELIVVILILGILAATALPKFINVTEQAHEAAVAGTAGGLGSAVALVHAQWIANGITGADTNGVEGFGQDNVNVNASGWPINTTGGSTAVTCDQVWDGVMQNPPSYGAGTTVDDGSDYGYNLNGTTCEYFYRSNVEGTNASNMSIFYDSLTGAITLDDDPN